MSNGYARSRREINPLGLIEIAYIRGGVDPSMDAVFNHACQHEYDRWRKLSSRSARVRRMDDAFAEHQRTADPPVYSRLTPSVWRRLLALDDVRAYQGARCGSAIDLIDLPTFLWWMRLSDGDRFDVYELSREIVQDEHMQETLEIGDKCP